MKEDIIRLIKEGLTYNEIRKKLGCSKGTISYHANTEGVFSRHKLRVVSDRDRKMWQRIHDNGYSLKDISRFTGASKATIKANIQYNHVYVKREAYYKALDKRVRMRVQKVESVKYLGGSCWICGYDKCLAALDFHHLDPSTKEFKLGSTEIVGKKLKKELDKCALLCARCHREVHAGLHPEYLSITQN